MWRKHADLHCKEFQAQWNALAAPAVAEPAPVHPTPQQRAVLAAVGRPWPEPLPMPEPLTPQPLPMPDPVTPQPVTPQQWPMPDPVTPQPVTPQQSPMPEPVTPEPLPMPELVTPAIASSLLNADHRRLPDSDRFRWTPDGAADVEIIAAGEAIRLQITMAYPVWSDVPARPGGQLRHLEMKHYNKSGYSFPGGPVSEPRARWKICAR